nr:MAG TPA_asm: hypothetical protein [Caudoviricetes sp.]
MIAQAAPHTNENMRTAVSASKQIQSLIIIH